MKLFQYCIILILTFVYSQTSAQNFKEQFNDYLSQKDTIHQKEILEKWKKSNENDPELYVAYFNYYANNCIKENIVLSNDLYDGEGLEILDNETSNKTPIGSIHAEKYYDLYMLQKGFDYMDMGIKKFPNRLDMRFGKIYMYGLIKDYEQFTNEILQTIDYSVTLHNNWTWTDNETKKDAKNFMLSAIQEYQNQLYNTNNDSLLENMKNIAERVLKYYPNHVESLSNVSVVYMIQQHYDKAIPPLLKAVKINPKDAIVLSNLAYAYLQKNDISNAIKYYELTIKYGDEEIKEYAKSQLEIIQNNPKK